MSIKNFGQYFGGQYMKYWYIAFVLVIGWFTIHLVNNGAVNKYELTIYDSNGKIVEKKIVDGRTMPRPERLAITKSYKPIKPIKFLD
jgi:hypothetical protein